MLVSVDEIKLLLGGVIVTLFLIESDISTSLWLGKPDMFRLTTEAVPDKPFYYYDVFKLKALPTTTLLLFLNPIILLAIYISSTNSSLFLRMFFVFPYYSALVLHSSSHAYISS